jgi:hypothetical protein
MIAIISGVAGLNIYDMWGCDCVLLSQDAIAQWRSVSFVARLY